MANQIHPTAVIGPDVILKDHLIIHPYVVIQGEVSIDEGTEIGAHVTISGWTKIGKYNRIFPHASIGFDPQDKKHKREDKTFLEIKDHNVIREFVTMNRGTVDGGGITRVGSQNLFMAYAHVAHDCQVGDHCILANSGTLAGHVIVEDHAIVGGLAALHQFCRIGRYAMLGGCSKATQDIPPFSLCDGEPATIYNLNIVGLKRAGMTSSTIKPLKEAFHIFFYSGLGKSSAIEKVEQSVEQTPEVKYLIEFAKASERGMCKASTKAMDEH